MAITQYTDHKFKSCPKCHGQSVVKQRVSKKAKATYEYQLKVHLQSKNSEKPVPLKISLKSCKKCNGTGIIPSQSYSKSQKDLFPHIAIIGGGIGGTALAVACLHRGIPFTLYERDASFKERSQGYGLTLQQASKAMKGLGIEKLQDGIISTRHIVHHTNGDILGSWGMRKWLGEVNTKSSKKTNIHIARQSLRWQLLQQLKGSDAIKWGHQFEKYELMDQGVQLNFNVDGKTIEQSADLVIGADGIRSKVRDQLIGSKKSPLNYLGCIVILGICAYKNLAEFTHELLDGATVFQTANGHERMYMMPYDEESIMWQFSYPMQELDAIELSKEGASCLQQDVINRTVSWHDPIPQILEATDSSLISGYPVYDRDLLQSEWMNNDSGITLLGDAAHPMSPFKGQGANQALLDALSLARTIVKSFTNRNPFATDNIKSFLKDYEKEMILRSSKKVTDSNDAVRFLHSKEVLKKVDAPRRAF